MSTIEPTRRSFLGRLAAVVSLCGLRLPVRLTIEPKTNLEGKAFSHMLGYVAERTPEPKESLFVSRPHPCDPAVWRVEAFDSETGGTCWVAVFLGANAKASAERHAERMNAAYA